MKRQSPLRGLAAALVASVMTFPLAQARLDSTAQPDVVDHARQLASNADPLWQELRAGFRMRPPAGISIDRYEHWFSDPRSGMVQTLTRGQRHLGFIVQEVQRRGMPTELALVPAIESAFNPSAVSPAAAAGLWQIMPATATDLGLTVNPGQDERFDIRASTAGALNLLCRLRHQFGGWELALVAYNWGPGNLERLLNQHPGITFERILNRAELPDETRNYVPKLLAARNLVLTPARFGVALPKAIDGLSPDTNAEAARHRAAIGSLSRQRPCQEIAVARPFLTATFAQPRQHPGICTYALNTSFRTTCLQRRVSLGSARGAAGRPSLYAPTLRRRSGSCFGSEVHR